MVVPMESETFGHVVNVCIGAMMVGSIELTVKPGQRISRGEEYGCVLHFDMPLCQSDIDTSAWEATLPLEEALLSSWQSVASLSSIVTFSATHGSQSRPWFRLVCELGVGSLNTSNSMSCSAGFASKCSRWLFGPHGQAKVPIVAFDVTRARGQVRTTLGSKLDVFMPLCSASKPSGKKTLP